MAYSSKLRSEALKLVYYPFSPMIKITVSSVLLILAMYLTASNSKGCVHTDFIADKSAIPRSS
jgi:hypothetical protein